MVNKPTKSQPAIFYDVCGTHKADTCENLKAAKKRGELSHSAFAHGCYPGVKMPPKMMPELCVACVWDANKDQSWGLLPGSQMCCHQFHLREPLNDIPYLFWRSPVIAIKGKIIASM
jgi:hypothetical protein